MIERTVQVVIHHLVDVSGGPCRGGFYIHDAAAGPLRQSIFVSFYCLCPEHAAQISRIEGSVKKNGSPLLDDFAREREPI